MSRYMWSPVYEGLNIVALVRGQERVTLAPGGVIAYASPPLPTVWDIEKRVTQFLEEVQRVVKPMGHNPSSCLLALWHVDRCQPAADPWAASRSATRPRP